MRSKDVTEGHTHHPGRRRRGESLRARALHQVFQCLIAIVLPILGFADAHAQASHSKTQIVFLGTGTPHPDPNRMGASVAIVVNATAYIVDAGTGVVRRAQAAAQAGIPALTPRKLHLLFITHLHSDHTLGYPDLIFTPWIKHRTEPLEVYGPPGIKAMTQHILMAWSEDIGIRTRGLEHGNTTGYTPNVHEITPGVIYQDSNVTVKAFLVRHGSWPEAFGYRFETPDRTIVLSGDTSPAQSIVDNCNGCDVLIHEVYTEKGYASSDTAWRSYIRNFHTSTTELADIASRAKPHLLILYHQMWFGDSTDTEASMLAEIRRNYKGRVVSAHDLDVR